MGDASRKNMCDDPSMEKEVSAVSAKTDGGLMRGVQIGSVFTFVFYVGQTLSIPFDQAFRDEIGCDALCQGSMQSARSALGLAGSFVVGRLSDQIGRRPAILLGTLGALFSHGLKVVVPSLSGMWIALVPSAFLDQNMTTLKALFADYFASRGCAAEASDTNSERAGAIGRLGLVMGVAMMVGSGCGSRIVPDFRSAHGLAAFISVATLPLIYALPAPYSSAESGTISKTSFMGHVRKSMTLAVLKRPGAWFLLGMRMGMSLAFWVFYPIFSPSLKERFGFGAKEQGMWFAFIGAVYAVAQGFVAKPLIRICTRRTSGHADVSGLLVFCFVLLGVGRIAALLSMDFRVVCASFGMVVLALGVANCILNSAAAELAGGMSETGGFFGLIEATEKLLGIIGPMIGGILSRSEGTLGLPNLTLACVVIIYAACAVLAAIFYHRLVEMDSGSAVGATYSRSKEE